VWRRRAKGRDDAHDNDGLTTFERVVDLPGAVGLDPVTGDVS